MPCKVAGHMGIKEGGGRPIAVGAHFLRQKKENEKLKEGNEIRKKVGKRENIGIKYNFFNQWFILIFFVF